MSKNFSARYLLTAGLILATLMFFASALPAAAQAGPAVELEQCANDSDGSNSTCANGAGIGWKNSQINGNNGSYVLGDFYPNRQIFSNLTAGNEYCFALGFDYSKSSLPAVDYIGTYNASIPADPTLDTPFTLGVDIPDTIAIPAEPALSNGGTIGGNSFLAVQIPGELTLWGGTFTAGSLSYSNPGIGDLDAAFQQSLDYCFTANSSDAVLAFGAHIAVPAEWGHTARPTGAPYHVSNGSRNGVFTAPRTSETDLVESSGASVVSNNNVGRREQQIQSSAISDPSPTAIALADVGQVNPQLSGWIVTMIMASLASISVLGVLNFRFGPQLPHQVGSGKHLKQ